MAKLGAKILTFWGWQVFFFFSLLLSCQSKPAVSPFRHSTEVQYMANCTNNAVKLKGCDSKSVFNPFQSYSSLSGSLLMLQLFSLQIQACLHHLLASKHKFWLRRHANDGLLLKCYLKNARPNYVSCQSLAWYFYILLKLKSYLWPRRGVERKCHICMHKICSIKADIH